jgi:hypothetical protein
VTHGVAIHGLGAGPPKAAPGVCIATPESVSAPFSSCVSLILRNFSLFNPEEVPRSVSRVLVAFCFDLFLAGIFAV